MSHPHRGVAPNGGRHTHRPSGLSDVSNRTNVFAHPLSKTHGSAQDPPTRASTSVPSAGGDPAMDALKKQISLYTSMLRGASALPDGGAKLRERVEALQAKLNAMQQSDQLLSVAAGAVPPPRQDHGSEHRPAVVSCSTTSSSTDAVPLPPGWVMKTSKSTGRTYFYHKETQANQWHHPAVDVKRATVASADDVGRHEGAAQPTTTAAWVGKEDNRDDDVSSKLGSHAPTTEASAPRMKVLSHDQLPSSMAFSSGSGARGIRTDRDLGWRPRVSPSVLGKEVSRILTAVPLPAGATTTDASDEASVLGLKVRLLPHQIDAVRWCRWREATSQVVRGGILADDMGLGKTITCLAMIACDGPTNGPTLVVCPASLLEQWRAETESRLDASRHGCVVYHGARRSDFDGRAMAPGTVVITTYDTLAQAHRASADAENKPQKDSRAAGHVDGGDGGDGGDGYKGQETGKGASTTPSSSSSSTLSTTPPSSSLFEVQWRRVLLDEGHIIRNGSTRACNACCALNAEARWIVTGSPLNNDSNEMHTLLGRFLRCGTLADKSVWRKQIAASGERGDQRLRALLGGLLLRRLKTDTNACDGTPLVLLPSRTDIRHTLRLSPTEREAYDAIARRACASLSPQHRQRMATVRGQERGGGQSGGCGSGDNGASVIVKINMLRRMCCHASLVSTNDGHCTDKNDNCDGEEGGDAAVATTDGGDGCVLVSHRAPPPLVPSRTGGSRADGGDDGDVDDLTASLGGLGLGTPLVDGDNGKCSSEGVQCAPTELFVGESTKLTAVADLVASLVRSASPEGPPSKVVVISQWTAVLDLIAKALTIRRASQLRLDGGTPVSKRHLVVNEFNDEASPRVLLLSMQAGGVGLNLVAANHCVVVDLPFNPATLDQATDRVYRIGQQRAVTVHTFVCAGTVEEWQMKLLERKRRMTDRVLRGTNDTQPTSQEIRELFARS